MSGIIMMNYYKNIYIHLFFIGIVLCYFRSIIILIIIGIEMSDF